MSYRRIRIRPPTRLPNVDREQEYEEGFELLSRAYIEIFHNNARILSYEVLYRTAYNLTFQQFGERLYFGVKDVISDYLESNAEEAIVPAFVNTSSTEESSSMGSDSSAMFMNTVKIVWDDYVTGLTMIRMTLKYLDDRLPKYNLPHITDMGLDLFRDKVIRSDTYPIQTQLIAAMLNQIQLERHGDVIDRSVIKAAVSMLSELTDSTTKESVYIVDFENKYLETSAAFYQIESQALSTSYDAPEFMRKVERRLEEEYERTIHCLSLVTEPKIRHIVESHLITDNLKTVIEMKNSGLDSMLNADKYGDLLRMYKLFSRVSAGLSELRTAMMAYILRMGAEINRSIAADIGDGNKPKTLAEKNVAGGAQIAIRWVEQVLDLQEKFDRILEFAVNNDKSFQTVFNEAFESFINDNAKSAEFISLFIDENLKKGLKGKSEDEVDDVLGKTITLFRFLRDKDVFERYYKQHLAKRLLFNRSVSDDAERGMLAKLKRECGYQFTNKLEGMFNDIKLSAEMDIQFKDFSDRQTLVDVGVTVLTSTFWPMNLSSSPKCNMPQVILGACESFEKFYFDRHSGRRLTWQPQMGTADIRATFKSSRPMLNVSTYAMVVLLLFNDIQEDNGLSLEDIRGQTQIPDADLKRTLQSLACAKYKVLTRNAKGRDIHPGDMFYFNTSFSTNLAKIKIQTVASKVENEGERKNTQDKVDEERKHQIEAAIVRIMKDRKSMEHNLLIAEVTKQLTPRFLPNPVMIKKRVEALIDREYLERSSEDRRSYRYLA
ncbi:Cullin [Phycomyces nitens]|nr:Cullin [Phycomyces nitens]